ncbi:MAG: transposase [Acidobacteria bacterium]|nr:transposase [Acidobacteriota bacterium]
MARVARSVLVDCPLHIVQRGINRGACFFSDGDYLTYLDYLTRFAPRFDCSLHAYCLMTNHVHLLLTPHTPNACALLMKNLGQRYVQGVNHRLQRSGTLWEGRFHSSLVTSQSYVLACYRYIELNPVRAGIVKFPGHYGWSSYKANAEGKPNGILRPHAAYSALGLDSQQRLRAYQSLCEEGVPDVVISEIRKATRVGSAMGARRRQRGRPSKLDEKNGVCPHY